MNRHTRWRAGIRHAAVRVQSVLLCLCLLAGLFSLALIPAAAQGNLRAVYLSDLDWSSATHGDRGNPGYTVQKDKPFEAGNRGQSAKLRLLVGGTEAEHVTAFDKGLSTNARSVITYDIAGKGYVRFTAYVGVDYGKLADYNSTVDGDKEAQVGNILVYADDTLLFESGAINPSMEAAFVDVIIPEGARRLVLEADAGTTGPANGQFWGDEVAFADAKVYADLGDPVNVAAGRTVTARKTADDAAAPFNPDRPAYMATDGVKSNSNYFDVGDQANSGAQRMSLYVELDLGQVCDLESVRLWRYWQDGRTYDATAVAVSQTTDFSSAVLLYNSDTAGVHGLGAGSDARYAETSAGKTFDAPDGTMARYVRLYVYGVQNGGVTNHIVELEVYAYTPPVPAIPPAFENADEPLDLTCPPIPHTAWTDNATHPDVVFVPGGWNGYEYWMGYTPNMSGSSYYENPCVAASHDGLNWEYPAANPVQPRFDSPNQNENEHYCDADLVYDSKNDRMILYWEWARDAGKSESEIQYRVSYDGADWGMPIEGERAVTTGDTAYGVTIHTDGARYSDLSPAIVYDAERDLYLMWANDAGDIGYNNGNRNQVWVRWSADGLSGWSDKQYVANLLGVNENGVQLYPWHLDVQYIEEFREYWAVVQAFPSGTNPNSSTLRLSKSKDGFNWEPVGDQPLLKTNPDASAWDHGQIYRTTFRYEPATDGTLGGGTFHLWYAGLSQGNRYWKIGYTSNDYLSVMQVLTQDLGYEEPPVVEATALSLGLDRELALNKTLALNPVFTPAGTTSRVVGYVSSDPSVASVDPFGRVTPHQTGTAVITAKVNHVDATAAVTITVVEQESKRYRVDNENPLLVMPLYGAKTAKTGQTAWDTGLLDWGDTLKGRWATVPDDLKPYTVVEIHPGAEVGTNNRLAQLQNFYKLLLDEAEAEGIPVMLVVATAGQQPQWTGTVGLTEEYLDGLFKQYSCLKGLMSTENYWTSYNTVATESLKFLKVAAENGGFYMWSEHKAGVLEAINANASFREALEKYGDSFIMTFKNTPSSTGENPASASIVQGMWLTGLCDQWGGLMDTWKWWEKKQWKLFEESPLPGLANGGEEARCVVSEPEALLYSEMLGIYLNGGCVYNFEHPGYTYGSNDKASPAFSNVIVEFMRYAVNNPAPTREAIAEQTKAVFHSRAGANFSSVAGSFYKGLNCEDYTQPTYTTGRYGLIPVVVKEVSEETLRACLPNARILMASSPELAGQQAKVSFFEGLYPAEYAGDTFAQRLGGAWFFYNSNENVNINQTAAVNLDGFTASLELEPHTNVRMDTTGAATGKLNVYINNYRVDKDPIWEGYTSSTLRWNTDTNMLMEAYMDAYTARPLEDAIRPTVFTLTGLSVAPTVHVNAGKSLATQYETPSVAYENGIAVITVMSNGYIDFDILLGDDTVEPTGVQLDKETLDLPLGYSGKLSATVLPLEAADRRVVWSSSDEETVYVDAHGSLTALREGEAVITVTLAGGTASASCTVSVSEIPVTAVVFEDDMINLWRNSTLQLDPMLLPAVNSDSSLTWTSSNPAVAAVDENGRVTALAGGTALITAASAYGPSAWVFVTVDAYAYKEIPRSRLTATANTEHLGNASEGLAAYAVDGNTGTIWHSAYSSGDTYAPTGEHKALTVAFTDGARTITRFDYTPRSGASNGTITKYNLLALVDGEWVMLVEGGEWAQDATVKTVYLDPVEAEAVRLECVTGVGGFASAAEIRICEQGDPIDPERVVENIRDLPPIADGDDAVRLPSMDGYTLRIVSSSLESVVGLDGRIARPSADADVQLILGLTCDAFDGESLAAPITVRIAGSGIVIPPVNKTLLKLTIDEAEYQKANYLPNLIPSVKERFEAALAHAWEVYLDDSGTYTQEDVYDADEALIDAMHYLAFTADKQGLKAAIEAAEEKISSGLYCDDDAMAALKAQLEACKELYDDAYATDTEIAPAVKALQDAADSLNLKPEFDTVLLEREIGLSDALDLTRYLDDDAMAVFLATLEDAKTVLERALDRNWTLAQSDVDDAVIALRRARLALRLAPSKDALKGAVERARTVDTAAYTEGSVKVMRLALDAALDTLNDPLASAQQINAAADTLNAAVDGLIPVENTGKPAPLPGDKTETKTPDPSDPGGEIEIPDTLTPLDGPGEAPKDKVNTGVSLPVYAGALLCLSLLTAAFIRRREKYR